MLRLLTSCVPISLVVLLTIGPGCSSTTPPGKEAATPQVAARLFGTYIQRNRGTPPKTLEQLKAFLAKLQPDELKSMGVDPAGIDQVFISPNDGKPLVLREPAKYGNTAGPTTVVLYEQEGKNGQRLVVFSMGQTEKVSAERFKELVPEAR